MDGKGRPISVCARQHTKDVLLVGDLQWGKGVVLVGQTTAPEKMHEDEKTEKMKLMERASFGRSRACRVNKQTNTNERAETNRRNGE